jgi:hypothetical protein
MFEQVFVGGRGTATRLRRHGGLWQWTNSLLVPARIGSWPAKAFLRIIRTTVTQHRCLDWCFRRVNVFFLSLFWRLIYMSGSALHLVRFQQLNSPKMPPGRLLAPSENRHVKVILAIESRRCGTVADHIYGTSYVARRPTLDLQELTRTPIAFRK